MTLLSATCATACSPRFRRQSSRAARVAVAVMGALFVLVASAACQVGTPTSPGASTPGATGTASNTTTTPTVTLPANGTIGPPSPTPSLTTGPIVEAGVLDLGQGETGAVEIRARNLPAPGLAGFTIDVFYDATVMRVTAVSAGDERWGGLQSNVVETGEVRLVGARAEGVTGDTVLAVLAVEAVGEPGDRTDIQLVLQRLVDSALADINVEACCGELIIR